MSAPVEFASFNTTPITGLTADSAWHTVDMTPYLTGSDATAVSIVSLLGNDTARELGAAPVGAGTAYLDNSKVPTTNISSNFWLVPLNENNEIQIYIETGTIVSFYFAGQINQGFVATPDTIVSFPANGSWYKRDVQNIAAGDSGNIEAVILQHRLKGDNTEFFHGMRPHQGTGWHEDLRQSDIAWHVVQINNANNEFSVTIDALNKRESVYQQVGYIKRGVGFTALDVGDTRATAPDPDNTWNDVTLTDIPDNATGAFVQLFHDANDTGLSWKQRGVRNKADLSGGATTNLKGMAITIGVNSDSTRTAQFFKQEGTSGAAEYAISGYAVPQISSAEISWELQQQIYTALSANSALTAFLANGADSVLDAVPQGTTFPYITVGTATATAWDTQDDQGLNSTVTIHSWSRHRGAKDIKQIMQNIHDTLHQQTLSLAQADTVTMRQEFSTVLLESDGLTRHGVQRFRILTSQN